MGGRATSKLTFVLLALTAGLPACAPRPLPPPISVLEYRDMEAAQRSNYPRQTVLLHNLQRVLDRDLDTDARIDSLKLAAELGAEEPVVLEQLAAVLSDPKTPGRLHDEVLAFLLSKNYPELAAYVVKVLPHVKASQPLRAMLLDWLTKHPSPALLSEVVKAWAGAQPASQADESYFRLVVERISAKPWDKALLEAVNSPGFSSRGSAMEILCRRLPVQSLKSDILKLDAKTEAVVVLQSFIRRFDYLPASSSELLASASIHLTRPADLDEAAKLSERWYQEYAYNFNIRDFHLVSRLAGRPADAAVGRAQLVSELSALLLRRRHVRHWIVPASQPDLSGRFDRQVGRLSMADLWNLRLVDEMLTRSSIQAALAVMADQDRADSRRAWGGLVFLQDGRAQARLYPPDPQASAGDLSYAPSERLLADGRDALCRFQAHFDTLHNIARAGPSRDELADAQRGNYCLLVLTSLSSSSFCAHYCNPDGVVVSLGQFPFAR